MSELANVAIADHDPVAAELAKRAAKMATHATDPGNKRKVRSGFAHLIDVMTWPVAALLDRNDRPSTSKVMGFAILGVFAVGKSIPATIAIALIASSFGYTAWKDFVAKGSWGVQATDAVSLAAKLEHVEAIQRNENLNHTITEVRGPNGEPMKSLPPREGATTPSGEE